MVEPTPGAPTEATDHAGPAPTTDLDVETSDGYFSLDAILKLSAAGSVFDASIPALAVTALCAIVAA